MYICSYVKLLIVWLLIALNQIYSYDVLYILCHCAVRTDEREMKEWMCVCTYVRMYVRMYLCMYVCMYERVYVCMYVRTYVRMYVCMYVCVYIPQNYLSSFAVALLVFFPFDI